MDEESKKKLCGTVSEFSKADNLLLGVLYAEQWIGIEREWLTYCEATGISPDDAKARELWLADVPPRLRVVS